MQLNVLRRSADVDSEFRTEAEPPLTLKAFADNASYLTVSQR